LLYVNHRFNKCAAQFIKHRILIVVIGEIKDIYIILREVPNITDTATYITRCLTKMTPVKITLVIMAQMAKYVKIALFHY